MTIERRGGRVFITCDTCGVSYEGDTNRPFAEIWDEAKREGWRVRKIADEWIHGCAQPNCKPE